MKKLKDFYKKARLANAYGGSWGSHCEWIFNLELKEYHADEIKTILKI